MGTVIQEIQKINYTTSTLLNSSKNCSKDSTMIGMKIAIIFIAIAMISLAVNAAPPNLEECAKKMDACGKECGKKMKDACTNGDLLEQISCLLAYTVACGIKCNEQAICVY